MSINWYHYRRKYWLRTLMIEQHGEDTGTPWEVCLCREAASSKWFWDTGLSWNMHTFWIFFFFLKYTHMCAGICTNSRLHRYFALKFCSDHWFLCKQQAHSCLSYMRTQKTKSCTYECVGNMECCKSEGIKTNI